MLVSSNPAFLGYLGPPISHIGQNPKNSRFFILFYFPICLPLTPIPRRGCLLYSHQRHNGNTEADHPPSTKSEEADPKTAKSVSQRIHFVRARCWFWKQRYPFFETAIDCPSKKKERNKNKKTCTETTKLINTNDNKYQR